MNRILVTLGNFFFRHRNRVFPLLMLAGVLTIRPGWPAGGYGMDLLMDVAGLALCLAGEGLRVLTIGYDYIKRGGKQQQVWAGRLVQGGVFAHCRNPLYAGNILIFIGVVLVFSAPLGLAVGVPLVLFIYACIIAAEEEFLRRKFGQAFEDYAARVNRILPDPRGFGRSIEGMQFRWRRVLNKEYGTFYAWVVVIIGLRAWTLRSFSHDAHRTEVLLLLLMFIPAALLYGFIRWLKKTGRLTEVDPATVDA